MSARQAARWKRAACPALARDSFSKSKIWRRNQGFGSHLGGLRVPVAQSSRWALAAPSARFAPSQISAFCALAARSPCICSHLRATQRGGATPKMVAVGRSGPCPQLIRYRPARFKMRMRGLSRASGASQASAARNARNPRASVSSALEAQETRLASPTGSQGHSPVRPSAAAGAPAPPAQAPGTSHRTPRAQAFRVSEGHKKRVSPHPPSQAPRSHPPRTTRQRFGEPQLSKLKSESSDMRGGFGSLASARQPYAASRPGALRRRARGKRRTPAEKIGASRAFPPSESYLAFASLYTPSHHRIGNWITAAMAAVYSTHTSARPKCPPSRATPLKYT